MNFATDLSIIQYIFTNLFLSFLFIFIYDVANTINVYDVHVQHTFIYRIYVRFVCVNVIVVVVGGDDVDVCKCSLAEKYVLWYWLDWLCAVCCVLLCRLGFKECGCKRAARLIEYCVLCS